MYKQFLKVTCQGNPMLINFDSIYDIVVQNGKCVIHSTDQCVPPQVIDESFEEICNRLDKVLC